MPLQPGVLSWQALPPTDSLPSCSTLLLDQFTDTALVRGMQQADAQQAAEVMRETGGRLLAVEQVRRPGGLVGWW